MPCGEIKDYIRLRDFTPGIYSASMNGLADHAASPAPLGAAQQTNTYRCIGLPAGGLAPLPGNTAIYAVPAGDQDSPLYYYPSFMETFAPIGTFFPFVGSSPPDELIFGMNYVIGPPAGPFLQKTKTYSLNIYQQVGSGTPPTTAIYGNAGFGGNNLISGSSHCITRIHATDYTQVGSPTLLFDVNNDSTLLAYPNPSNPTVYQCFAWTPFNGQVLGHQGRAITLRSLPYTHPPGSVFINEQINFNDPPNAFVDPTTGKNEVFIPESPTGYGAWGSISIGELFLVKNKGGAVYVTGDVANPTITRLPAVQSTGGLISNATSTPIGFMYPTLSSGMYLWNGGNTAQKISRQLDDQFYHFNQNVNPQNSGVLIHCEQWQDWVLVSNNWLYDTVTRSWWRMEDPTQHFDGVAGAANYGVPSTQYRYYTRSYSDNIMYCAVDRYFNVNTGSYGIWQYDRNVPANSFSWQSHPIPVTTEMMVDVRELVLLAQGKGQIWVTLTDSEGNVQLDGPNKFMINSPDQPQRLRVRTQIHGFNIIVRIQSMGNPQLNSAATILPAPVIYELDLGWTESTMAASV